MARQVVYPARPPLWFLHLLETMSVDSQGQPVDIVVNGEHRARAIYTAHGDRFEVATLKGDFEI